MPFQKDTAIRYWQKGIDKLKMQARSKRRSSLELLRILGMLFIIAHHFSVHGQYGGMEMSSFNGFIKSVLYTGGKLGVNIYVLISGYFLAKSDFKPRRAVNILTISFFYSMIIYFALLIAVPDFGFSWGNLETSIRIVHSRGYWFVGSYVVMVLLSPFLNKMMKVISEREHILLILLLLVTQLTLPGVAPMLPGSDNVWFVTLYLIAAYIRLYPKKIFENKLVCGIACIVFCTVLALWEGASNMTNLFCLLPSVSLFCFFNSLDIKSNRFINLVASTTFGVYLIHDNLFIRQYLWGVWFNCPFHATLDSFWLFSALAIVTVFVGSSIIELLRITLTKPLMPYLDRLWEKTCRICNRLFNKKAEEKQNTAL